MDESNTSYYKAPLLRIKYIIDTKDYFYRMKQDRKSMGHGNYMDIVRWTIHEITTLRKL